MPLRHQYHLRKSDRGILAWNVNRLIALTVGLKVEQVRLSDIAELDEPHWFGPEGDSPTCRVVSRHARLIAEADLNYPIIIDDSGRVLDGMHRVCKALGEGADTILAYRLDELPDPDHEGVDPATLSYETEGEVRPEYDKEVEQGS
ncbi:MAG: hypothetical protein AAF514_11335 [Verrucomicrobiota bacterium]